MTKLRFLLASWLLVLATGITTPLFSIEELEGWPVELKDDEYNYEFRVPQVVNLDGGDDVEVVVATNGGLFVFKSDGTILDGWPFPEDDTMSVRNQPAVGDIDGDGEPDVVFVARDGNDDLVYALEVDGEVKEGWPVEIDNTGSNEPHLGDLDGDGALEIVIAAGRDQTILVFDGDGEDLEGWPLEIELDLEGGIQAYGNFRGVAVGDLEFDGKSEIVVTVAKWDGGDETGGEIHVYDLDGELRDGWPVKTQGSSGRDQPRHPIIVDLDGDSVCEIVTNSNDVLHILNEDGTDHAGPWSDFGGFTGIATVGDLDGDGDREIVTAGTTLRIFECCSETYDEMLTAETSAEDYHTYKGAILVDVDGDGTQEIAAWSSFDSKGGSNALHVFDSELVELSEDWPVIPEGDYFFPPSINHLAAADLDGDGDIEFVYPYPEDNVLHALDLENDGALSPTIEWGSFHGNASSARFYHFGRYTEGRFLRGDASGDRKLHLNDMILLYDYFQNGGDHECPATLDFSGDGTIGVIDLLGLTRLLFLNGPDPTPPYPNCGPQPTTDTLECSRTSCDAESSD